MSSRSKCQTPMLNKHDVAHVDPSATLAKQIPEEEEDSTCKKHPTWRKDNSNEASLKPEQLVFGLSCNRVLLSKECPHKATPRSLFGLLQQSMAR